MSKKVKNYIRKDSKNIIIRIFTDDFEKKKTGDICVNEDGPRHFHLEGGLVDQDGKYNYKYVNNKIVKRTDAEKWPQADIDEKVKEELIQKEMCDLARKGAIDSLKAKGKLNANGDLVK